MNTLIQQVNTFYDKTEDYIQTQFELIKLNTIDKSADVVSSLAHRIVFAMVAGMFILFLNIGIGLWLGNLLGAYHWGFIIVSGFYLLSALLIYIFRKPLIKNPISNLMLSKMLKKVDLDGIIQS